MRFVKFARFGLFSEKIRVSSLWHRVSRLVVMFHHFGGDWGPGRVLTMLCGVVVVE